jgi:lambda family phage portal protein
MATRAQQGNWLDRAVGFLAPRAGLMRLRARVAHDLLRRHYEGAAAGRRTQGWNRSGGDANAVVGPALSQLRTVARDLVRNNPNAKSALRTITNHVVGWGITAKPNPNNAEAEKVWKEWAESTACDSDGRHNLYGLQKLVMRTVVESGECLIRRRLRRPEDELPLPMQIQVLDPDYLDTSKNELVRNPEGTVVRNIVQGVEFDTIGRRRAYWMFSEHPGSEQMTGNASRPVPAESVLHVYYQDRPGQVRGPSWFAPVLLRFKDFDEYEDATLMKQKIAACLAVLVSNGDGTGLGSVDASGTPQVDSLEPGLVEYLPAGADIKVVEPPSVREYSDYVRTSLRAIATGLGVTYEDLTGDYADMPFSAARMSRISHWDRVNDWRWQLLIPQFCDPVWAWAMQVAGIMGRPTAELAEWTAPPAPMVDPANEGLAYQRNIRTGIMSLSEAIRERGYDPDTVLKEIAKDNEKIDKLELVLDSDPRKTSQAGQPTAPALPAAPTRPALPAAPDDEEEDKDGGEDSRTDDARGRSRPGEQRARRKGRTKAR